MSTYPNFHLEFKDLEDENEKLQAKVGRLEKAILDFGNNPAGFDWAVLERIERLESGHAAIMEEINSNPALHNDPDITKLYDIAEQALKESK